MLNPGAGKWGWFGNILKPLLDVFAVGNHVNSRATSCVYSSLYLPLLFSNRKSRLLNPQIFFLSTYCCCFIQSAGRGSNILSF